MRYRCGKCGRLGANARTCGTGHEPLADAPPVENRQPDPVLAALPRRPKVATTERARIDAPADLGPWSGCTAGDPWCACTRGRGH